MKRPGDRYTNEKGQLCQVIAVAKDDRDGMERIVYQQLSGNYEFRIEYVDVPAPVREPIEVKSVEAASKAVSVQPVKEAEKASEAENVEVTELFEGEVNPALLAFLEADEIDEKLEVLYRIKDTTDEKLLTAIEASLDIAISEGSPEERVAFIRRNLMTKAKYEGGRLRS